MKIRLAKNAVKTFWKTYFNKCGIIFSPHAGGIVYHMPNAHFLYAKYLNYMNDYGTHEPF